MKQIIIIGAGAAGLTAAIFAGRCGAAVTVLEHTDKAGKKILSTGNGKCNITNRFQEASCYRGNDTIFAMEVLKKFNEKDTVHFMESLGILCKERNGYIYPRSEQASTVRDGLLMECRRLGVVIEYKANVQKIQREKDGFVVLTKICDENKTYCCQKLILATGSKAMPITGSDGSGYELAKALGLKIIKPLPALVQLKCEKGICKEAAGVRCAAKIAIMVNGDEIAEETGELQITNYGISGIPVLQMSRFAVKALETRKQVEAVIDFFPEMEEEELQQKLEVMIKRFPEKAMEDILCGFLNRKLGNALLREMGVKKGKKAKACDEIYIEGMTSFLKAYKLQIIGFNSFSEAQVCQGGAATDEIDSATMECKRIPGLYLAGEVVDIDGTCGGYNLQFAWSTGAVAGKAAAR